MSAWKPHNTQQISEYCYGPPPSVGWWETRLGYHDVRRYWNGQRWSHYVVPGRVTGAEAREAAERISAMHVNEIQWRGLLLRSEEEEWRSKLKSAIVAALKEST